MQDRPPGLVRRRMFRIDQGRVVVEEEWNTKEPGCPLIQNPWISNPLVSPTGRYVRQVEMTEAEFAQANPTLFN